MEVKLQNTQYNFSRVANPSLFVGCFTGLVGAVFLSKIL